MSTDLGVEMPPELVIITKVLGDKIANSLLQHDERTSYQETQLDILFERQRWLPGDSAWSAQNIFNRNAHPPFVSPTNEALQKAFNESVEAMGAWSYTTAGDNIGPSQNIDSPLVCTLTAGSVCPISQRTPSLRLSLRRTPNSTTTAGATAV